MYGCLQDLLFVLLLSCAFGAAAVLGGLSNTEWNDKYVQNPAYQEYEDVLVAMKKSTVATTVRVKICIVYYEYLLVHFACNIMLEASCLDPLSTY